MVEVVESILGFGLVVLVLLGFLSLFTNDPDNPNRYRGAGTIHESDNDSSE